jgi:peptidoglycan/LPS O-acetylase OafA/YrhL
MTPLTTKPSWGGRLVGVEGLRALAALSVLFSHVISASGNASAGLGSLENWLRPNLDSGLTLFFTLSGFLLYRPFAAAVLRNDPLPSTRAYLRNRGLRILPGYWAILILSGLVFGAATLVPASSHIGSLTDPGLLARNLLLVQTYSPSGVGTGVSASWSLSVEIVFYLTLPLLALSAARFASGRERGGRVASALVPAAVLLAIGVVGKIAAFATIPSGPHQPELWGNTWHAVLERSFLANADLFAFGMCAAVVLVAAEDGWFTAPRLQRACGAGALALAGALIFYRHRAHVDDRIYTTLIAVSCGLLVLWLTLPWRTRRSIPVRVLESRAAVWIGVTSYSVYLWHQPVVDWLREHGHMQAGSGSAIVNLGIVLAIVLPLSTLTYRLVEAPAMRRKARMTPRETPQGVVSPEPSAAAAAP